MIIDVNIRKSEAGFNIYISLCRKLLPSFTQGVAEKNWELDDDKRIMSDEVCCPFAECNFITVMSSEPFLIGPPM